MKWKIYLLLAAFGVISCNNTPTPKPRGYFRIDFPEKEYTSFTSECAFSFEYPVYGEVKEVNFKNIDEHCWYNIDFPQFKAKIHLTYKPIAGNNLAMYTEDIRSLVYKHIVKADDIEERLISEAGHNVYGIMYDLSGNTAASTTFYVTDSVNHFLSGSLYFSTVPNKDSLAPVLQYFREDIVHLTRSLNWN